MWARIPPLGFYAEWRPCSLREFMVERTVFINYRGADSDSYGALLYQHLVGHFGAGLVFVDCESIPAGADFVEELLGRVRSARVLLAVIGPRWLTATDPMTGQRLIDNPDDWIRRELREAFIGEVRVIPVLTEQIAMPVEGDLPADIAVLGRCQYRRLRHHDSTADLARIVADLTGLDPVLAEAIAADSDMIGQETGVGAPGFRAVTVTGGVHGGGSGITIGAATGDHLTIGPPAAREENSPR